jgi:hypothetical protein
VALNVLRIAFHSGSWVATVAVSAEKTQVYTVAPLTNK